MIEKPAPAFDLAGLGGSKPLALDALKGHPFVINFFASWCVPCRIEHPLLMRLAEQDHLPLYGIAYKDKPDDSHAAAGAPSAIPTGRSGSTGTAGSGWISASTACRRPMSSTAPA